MSNNRILSFNTNQIEFSENGYSLDNRLLDDINNLSYVYRKHIRECDFFEIFKFNIKNMQNCFTLYNTGIAKRLEHCPDNFSDFHALNALVINCISSGRTLTETIEKVNKEHSYCISEKFKEYTNEIYEKFFSYRFMCFLRNYVQHGDLPIISCENQFCFDLDKILITSDFNLNSKREAEFKRISENIRKKYSDKPRIAFTQTILEYFIKVLEIYKFHLKETAPILKNHLKQIKRLVLKNPDLILNILDFDEKLVIFKIENNSTVAFTLPDNICNSINSQIKKVESILDVEKVSLEKLSEGFKY